MKSCDISVGLEQEYFLIDKKYFDARVDLKLCGRTLFGAPATKGQELDDHYFGAIPLRVKAFMKEVNEELWKLGIYAKTEHNEVAPAQFELAPVFSGGNIAVDQNLLIMDVLKKVADKHGFACLLHEKPFDGINGSGKHNNYSIVTDDGQNLFDPGKKPMDNIRFLTFTCAFIEAVDTYPVLLRLAASSAGNDFRLGANEAPPAIISIYLGSYIEDILYSLHSGKRKKEGEVVDSSFEPVKNISYIPHDNTDRNRTSPVAFTGNKFEFRMPGSSMNASFANTVLNTIIAHSLKKISEELDTCKTVEEVREKALEICKKIIKKHKRVLFSGDGYSSEWIKEAERRGLPNVKSFIEASQALKDKDVVKLFTGLGVYTETELMANEKILEEEYYNIKEIEIKTLIAMVKRDVLPAMCKEYDFYAKANGEGAPAYLTKRSKKLAELIDATDTSIVKLEETHTSVKKETDTYERGYRTRYEIVPLMQEVRASVDAYEELASKCYYKLPTYEDMLFDL